MDGSVGPCRSSEDFLRPRELVLSLALGASSWGCSNPERITPAQSASIQSPQSPRAETSSPRVSSSDPAEESPYTWPYVAHSNDTSALGRHSGGYPPLAELARYRPGTLNCDVAASPRTRSLPPAELSETSSSFVVLVEQPLVLDRRVWGGAEPAPALAWRRTEVWANENLGWWLVAPTRPDRWVAVAVDSPCGPAPISWARQPKGAPLDQTPTEEALVDFPEDWAPDGQEGLMLWLPPSSLVPGTWWVFVGAPTSHPGPIFVAWLDAPADVYRAFPRYPQSDSRSPSFDLLFP